MAAHLPQDCRFGSHRLPDVRVVAGEVDGLNAEVLQTALDGVWAEDPRHLVIDLTPITFLGVPGLHVLRMAGTTARRRGATRHCAPGPGTCACWRSSARVRRQISAPRQIRRRGGRGRVIDDCIAGPSHTSRVLRLL